MKLDTKLRATFNRGSRTGSDDEKMKIIEYLQIFLVTVVTACTISVVASGLLRFSGLPEQAGMISRFSVPALWFSVFILISTLIIFRSPQAFTRKRSFGPLTFSSLSKTIIVSGSDPIACEGEIYRLPSALLVIQGTFRVKKMASSQLSEIILESLDIESRVHKLEENEEKPVAIHPWCTNISICWGNPKEFDILSHSPHTNTMSDITSFAVENLIVCSEDGLPIGLNIPNRPMFAYFGFQRVTDNKWSLKLSAESNEIEMEAPLS